VLGPGGRARRAAPNWAGDGDASVRREELRGSADAGGGGGTGRRRRQAAASGGEDYLR
jgi:hypothetical protein